MPETDRFYVTTPIYYVNDRPHIGHVYTTTIADVVARYHRLRGEDVFFLTGVDEHAAKVSEAAEARGLTPQDWADQNATVFRETFTGLGFTNDDFVRTSSEQHKAAVQRYVAALLTTGDVYQGEYEGWYDAGQEEYVTDGKAAEYDYKSPINGKPLIRKKEQNYFFKLESYREQVIEAINSGTFQVEPAARRNEILNRLAEARDVPISRSGTGGWGIPMPNDPQQSIYVWIDALFNYLSYIDTDDRRGYWEAGAVHFIAKDILWFHAAIWPAMLLALRKCEGYDWVRLPRTVYSHSFWISEGQKMSKSLGNFIDLEKINQYVTTFSLDALRYFLATQGPMGTTDSDFAEAKFIEVYNSDLANTLGNSFSRVSNMTAKYFDGKVVAQSGDEDTWHGPAIIPFVFSAAMERDDIELAFHHAMSLVRQVDSYIEQTKPFTLAKDPANLPQVGTILYNCAEALRIASVLLWPVLPTKCEAIWQRLGLDYAEQMRAAGGKGKFDAWTQRGLLEPGTAIEKGDALFPRYQPPVE